MNLFVISSNCKNGPSEILDNGKNGILYESNNKKALIESLEQYSRLDKKEIYKKTKLLKKKTREFTIFNHYKKFINIMENIQYG